MSGMGGKRTWRRVGFVFVAMSPQHLWRRMTRVERIIMLLGVANMVLSLIFFFALGGTAFHGAQHDGLYFLGDGHSHFTEVSRETYRLSQVQGASILLSTLAAFIVGLIASARNG